MRVKIVGEQYDIKGNKLDEIVLVSEAEVQHKDGVYIIDYEESINNPDSGKKTRVRAYENKLSMTKFGTVSSVMEFEAGKAAESLYATEYGSIKMNVETVEYKYDFNENCTGEIHLRYKISMGDDSPFENVLNIKTFI